MIVLWTILALVFVSVNPISSNEDALSLQSDLPSEITNPGLILVESRKRGKGKPNGRPSKSKPGGKPSKSRPVSQSSKSRPSGKPSKARPVSKPSKGKPGGKPSKSKPIEKPSKPNPMPSTSGTGFRRPGSSQKIPTEALNNDACNGKSLKCNSRSPYRTITGVCNNLQSPYLGATNSIMKRFLSSEYNDCTGEPKGGFSQAEERTFQSSNYSRKGYRPSKCSKNLPNVREVSIFSTLILTF